MMAATRTDDRPTVCHQQLRSAEANSDVRRDVEQCEHDATTVT
ncbi:hypothetical protein [Vibrio fluvialis]|nr:hypothetical protein [Vibrio fluvialis]